MLGSGDEEWYRPFLQPCIHSVFVSFPNLNVSSAGEKFVGLILRYSTSAAYCLYGPPFF